MFRGWYRDSCRGPVGVIGPLVKDQGGRLLTGIGGNGGAEDWMVLGALRHHIRGLRNRRLDGLRGLNRLGGLRLAGQALLLQLLQFPHGRSEGTLQTGASRGYAIQKRRLFIACRFVLVDMVLAGSQACEEPLGDGHLLEVEPLGAVVRLPIG